MSNTKGMVNLARRRVLVLLGLSAAGLAAGQLVFSKKSDKELEGELLKDFLTFFESSYMDKKGIESLLFDIERYDGTRGRALHIGDGYFLTAYHVVDEEPENMRLIPQSRRGYVIDFGREFNIVSYDDDSDLALLQVPLHSDTKKGKALIHLADRIPSVGEPVSGFIRLVGPRKYETYELEFGGKDFYDGSKEVKRLGKLILPSGSLLLEKQGEILKYDEDYLSRVRGNLRVKPVNENFTSLSVFDGESGSPVFLRIASDKYIFAGIMVGLYGIKHVIPTPNHPLRYKSMQQTGAFFVHREPIEKLILSYLAQSPQ